MKLSILILFFAGILLLESGAVRAAEPSVTHSPWITAAVKHDLDPVLLYAIALTESKRAAANARVRPWPWTLGTPAGPLYFATYEEALGKLRELLATGTLDIDIGLMQISWRYNGYLAPDPAELLRPETNIEVGARILRKNLDTLLDTRSAVARYHSPDKERGLAYAEAVLTVLERLRAIEGFAASLSAP